MMPPISAQPSPTLKRVMWGLSPYPDESLLGFIARTAEHNVLESTYAITRQAGQAHANRTTTAVSPAIRQEELAYILRIDPCEVSRRSYVHPEGELKRDFYGVTLRYTDVESKVRRFSPSSLQHAPYHRAAWDCRLLPFCPESWDFLLGACHQCNAQQLWRIANGVTSCDRCSADLREAPASRVPENDRKMLGWFADLLSPFEQAQDIAKALVAPSLAHLSTTLLVALAVRLLWVVDPWVKQATFNGWRQDPARYLRALSVALPMLQDWPCKFLSHVRETQAGKGSSWRESSVKSCDRFLKKLLIDKEPALRIVGEVAFARLGAADEQAAPNHMDLQEAAELLGRGAPSLKEWRGRKLLRATVGLRNGQLTHCFDRAEITFLAEFTQDRVSAEAFAASFGMTYYGVEQLVCMQLLTPTSHPWIQAVYDTPQFSRREITKLTEMLWNTAKQPSAIENGRSLTDTLKSIGGKLRPWGPIIQALLRGEIPYTLRREGKTLASRIIVDQASRSRLASLDFDRRAHPSFEFDLGMSMLDAAANLNVSAPKATFLGALQRPRIFAHKYRNIPVATVEELASQFISAQELTALTGWTWSKLTAHLSHCGFGRSHPMGWDRACLPSFEVG